MPEELKEAYLEYEDGKISRREFMQKAIVITGSLAAANSLLAALGPAGPASAQVSSPSDPAILTHNVEYQGKAGPVLAYLARASRRESILRSSWSMKTRV